MKNTPHLLRTAFLLGLVAAGPATTQNLPDVSELIAQLSSDAFPSRQRAQDQLVSRGEQGRAAIEKALKLTKDEEVRTRLEAVLRTLDADQQLAPTLISLNLSDSSPQAALDAIATQAHVQFVTAGELLGPALSMHIDQKPFWTAMKELCGKANLNLGPSRDPAHWSIVQENQAPMAGPSVIDGPFLVSLESAQISAWLPFADPARANQDFTVHLGVFLEPRSAWCPGG